MLTSNKTKNVSHVQRVKIIIINILQSQNIKKKYIYIKLRKHRTVWWVINFNHLKEIKKVALFFLNQTLKKKFKR